MFNSIILKDIFMIIAFAQEYLHEFLFLSFVSHVNIDSGNGFVLSGTNQLPVPRSTMP